MPGRKGGLFYSGSRTYRFCGQCNDPNVSFVPLGQWCKANGITTDQARTLFKRRILLGRRHKGRIFVALNPEFKDLADSGYVKWKHS
jgi:hypothetical protein